MLFQVYPLWKQKPGLDPKNYASNHNIICIIIEEQKE